MGAEDGLYVVDLIKDRECSYIEYRFVLVYFLPFDYINKASLEGNLF